MPKNTTISKTAKRGLFIVIDGGDGSGKATQAELLVAHFRKQKMRVKYFDFPQYSEFFGKLVGRFLTGEFGKMNEVSPYLASLTFALDRWSMKTEINKWLEGGGHIICNRYVTSNIAHQSARISSPLKRAEFVSWVKQLEYKVLGVPKEDVVIFLQVPPVIAKKLTSKKAQRAYMKTKKDIAERSQYHQVMASKMYIQLAKSEKNWIVIQCMDQNNSLLPIASIQQTIVQSLQSRVPSICNPLKKLPKMTPA